MNDLEKIAVALDAAADEFFRGGSDFMVFHGAAEGNNELQLSHAANARILQTWGAALRAASRALTGSLPEAS